MAELATDAGADTSGITLVCCGLIGTLVADDGLIERSYAEAIATQGIVAGTSAFARRMAQVHQVRGRGPGDVMRALFPENEPRAQAAQLAFDRALPDAIGRTQLATVPGAVQMLEQLRAAGCRICVLTGLPRRVVDLALDGTDLRRHIDVALCGGEGPRGFPAPDLALTAMLRVGVGSVREVAIVHSTGAALECGRRAGASVVAGVLTGPHGAARLRSSGATHVLESVADLPPLVLGPTLPAGPASVPAAGPANRAAGASVPAQAPFEPSGA